MYPRLLEKKLQDSACHYPIVVVTGPRQSGKTTLVRAAFPKHRYLSLESPDERDFAAEDPRGFLSHAGPRAILDEVQRVPDLLSYLQTLTDERDEPGQFILSGSQNLLLLHKVTQSLAGRAAVLHLLPLSLAELQSRSPLPMEKIGQPISSHASHARKDLWKTLFMGFYPRIHDKHLEPQDWLRNYYQTYVERDVRQIVNVGDIETFGRFVRLCAGRSGQLLNLSSLATDCGVTHTTARRWLSVLEASFLIYLLRPHHRNFNKRVIKSPKLYFIDSGLLCQLVRIQSPDNLKIHSMRGAIFEGFVVAEFLKQFLNNGLSPDLYFWRDSQGNEVDVLVETAGKIIPVEIKSGETVASDFFKGIGYWKKLNEPQKVPTALIYAGNESFSRSETMIYSWQQL